ncbi:MAG: metalloregulator ArsR/SmtB family transcription factor [Cyclobacteriaceae bacterium]|jgi:ArsR family transcriptional regulator|nr:metalloregulator ArsR/SmtB family transcription factor [Cyclobacteriaceae bacterium]
MAETRRQINYNKLGRVSEIFGGLAHPTRLEILEILEGGKAFTVGEILNEIKIDPTLLTHHLSKMKHLGILKSYKEGRNVYYQLEMLQITSVLECIQNCEIKY